jgi:ribosomal protein S18 acetylase RimI-like enzyme
MPALRSFAISDLTADDLSSIGWSGNPAHIRTVEAKLQEADLDYLAIRGPDGAPVAIGCVTYSDGSGDIGQLAVREELQSMGLGSRLVEEAERRMRERGLETSTLGVEVGNTRARELYERLGYVECGTVPDSWTYEDAEGNLQVHETEVVLMRKGL